MSNNPYNVYYNNNTGRIVVQKNDHFVDPCTTITTTYKCYIQYT